MNRFSCFPVFAVTVVSFELGDQKWLKLVHGIGLHLPPFYGFSHVGLRVCIYIYILELKTAKVTLYSTKTHKTL